MRQEIEEILDGPLEVDVVLPEGVICVKDEVLHRHRREFTRHHANLGRSTRSGSTTPRTSSAPSARAWPRWWPRLKPASSLASPPSARCLRSPCTGTSSRSTWCSTQTAWSCSTSTRLAPANRCWTSRASLLPSAMGERAAGGNQGYWHARYWPVGRT